MALNSARTDRLCIDAAEIGVLGILVGVLVSVGVAVIVGSGVIVLVLVGGRVAVTPGVSVSGGRAGDGLACVNTVNGVHPAVRPIIKHKETNVFITILILVSPMA